MKRNTVRLSKAIVLAVTSLAPLLEVSAEEPSFWGHYRGDARRSGNASSRLPDSLELLWSRSFSPPTPAWPHLDRMAFDSAHHVVSDGERIFITSSTDDTLRCLDAATGTEIYSITTGGPIRLAPAIEGDLIFVASDDGWLRAFDRETGEERWSHLAGPDNRKVIGNGRLISRWPVRGGPVAENGVVYFAAGIWPTEGVFVYALDARSGEVVWKNGDTGSIFMPQPHGGADAHSGVAAQGHLVVTDDLILVPTGRSVPAAFSRDDGTFQYFHLQKYGSKGGSETMASGKIFFNSGLFFDAKTGASLGSTGATAVAGIPDGLATATSSGVKVFQWQTVAETGERQLAPVLSVPIENRGRTIITTDEKIIAGGADGVAIIDATSGEVVFTTATDGSVLELCLAGGRLFASTDRGTVACFGTRDDTPIARASPRSLSVDRNIATDQWASDLLDQCEVRDGYCILMTEEGLDRAISLAEKSHFRILLIEEDRQTADRVRRELLIRNLNGRRITVIEDSPSSTSLPSAFADLVVATANDAGPADARKKEALRLQRPHGGLAVVGMESEADIIVRGAPPGEGNWTHQYADSGNSSCSNDTIQGPLALQWFEDVGQPLTQRHGRGPAPLYLDGRLYSLGLDSLVAVDAFNGRKLFEAPIPGILTAYDGDHMMGTSGTQSPYCVSKEGVFVRQGNRCLVFDPATGKKTATFEAPYSMASESVWGWIAVSEGLVLGSLADSEHVVTYRYLDGGDLNHQLTESHSLFAKDAVTGETLWKRAASDSIRHNAIALGGGILYYIDRPLALFDRTRDIKGGEHPPGKLMAVDAATGETLFEKADATGTLLALSADRGVLVMGYQPTRYRLASELGGRLTGFDSETGEILWDVEADYKSRPILNGDTIYTEGIALDLKTGAPVTFTFSRSYGCGVLASGENLLLFRSATLGYFEFTGEQKTKNFGGIRPGCWINAIPAGGRVLVPDGSSGCVCSYQNKAWIALAPEETATSRR